MLPNICLDLDLLIVFVFYIIKSKIKGKGITQKFVKNRHLRAQTVMRSK